MTIDIKKTAQHETHTQQQRQQAKRVLVLIQWLLIIVLIGMMIWLFINQQKLNKQIDIWQKNQEQTINRLNDMDDRLFAISQNSLPATPPTASNNAKNQMELLHIQLQTIDKILAEDDTSSAIKLLQGIHWQLSQPSNEIAPALTIALKNSIHQDIQYLQAQNNQPSPWQLQSLAIQDIQSFLSNQIQHPAHGLDKDLTAYDAMIYEVMMTLNLAMQACHMRQTDMMTNYLQQAKAQIKPLEDSLLGMPLTQAKAANTPNSPNQTAQTTEKPELKSLADVSLWLDNLIKNAPKHHTLMTTKMLADSQ